MKGSKDRQLARLLHLVPLLLEGGRSREELIVALAEALAQDDLVDALPAAGRGEDPTSAFSRDWRLLRDLGVLESAPGRRKPALPGRRLPLWVTPVEAEALAAAEHALLQLGLSEHQALRDLVRRVRRPPRRPGGWSLAPSLRGIRPEVWSAVNEAIEQGRRLRIQYRYPDRPVPEARELDRARIVWLTGAFYVCALRPDLARLHGESFEAVREYRVDRILAVEVLDVAASTSTLPFLEVRFRLSPELAGRLHDMADGEGRPVQRVSQLANGELRVVIQEVSALRARQRLLAFGRELRGVDDPAWLRTLLGDELKQMSAQLAASDEPARPHA